MDGENGSTGTVAVVENLTQAAVESAVTEGVAATAITTATNMQSALDNGVPAGDVLHAFFGGGSLDKTDEPHQTNGDNGLKDHLKNVDVVIEHQEDDQEPTTGTPDDTVKADTTDKQDNGEQQEDEQEDDEEKDDKPIESARSEDEIAMSEAVAKARDDLKHIHEDLMVIKAALEMIPHGLPPQERAEKLEMLKVKERFTTIKSKTDAFATDIMVTEEQFLDSQDFHKYIIAFDALKADGEKARREAAVAYRKTFNLQPDIESAIPKSWTDILRAPVHNAINSAAIKMGWSKEVDTLFTLTDKEKESILEAHREAMKETNKHRKEQIMEMGIMGLMMTLQEVEQMAHEAKRQADAPRAA